MFKKTLKMTCRKITRSREKLTGRVTYFVFCHIMINVHGSYKCFCMLTSLFALCEVVRVLKNTNGGITVL